MLCVFRALTRADGRGGAEKKRAASRIGVPWPAAEQNLASHRRAMGSSIGTTLRRRRWLLVGRRPSWSPGRPGPKGFGAVGSWSSPTSGIVTRAIPNDDSSQSLGKSPVPRCFPIHCHWSRSSASACSYSGPFLPLPASENDPLWANQPSCIVTFRSHLGAHWPGKYIDARRFRGSLVLGSGVWLISSGRHVQDYSSPPRRQHPALQRPR